MTFLFYDFETTGADPRRDCPTQFAAVRTDAELNEVGTPTVLYARLAEDCLPHPMAVLVTGLLPDDLTAAGGGSEYDMARKLVAELSQPQTCAVGFNSMRFDAELLRFLFWRNFFDPYAHEWRDGNSRWDILDVARAFRVLRPESIQWPVGPDGQPSLRLEALTAANGIDHGQAHDALADVRATIAVARRLRDASQKLFDYLLGLRDKRKVARIVDERARSGFVHVSGRLPTAIGNASMFVSFGAPPGMNNQRLLWDLRHDPAQLLDESVERLQARRFLSNEDITEEMDRLPMKILHINRAPVVVTGAILNEDDVADRMAIDRDAVLRHQAFVDRHYEDLCARMQAVVRGNDREFARQASEQALYDGFLPEQDRAVMTRFHQLLEQDSERALSEFERQVWQDERLGPMARRFLARNWPNRLGEAARTTWREHLQETLFAEESDASGEGLSFASFFTEIDRLTADPDRSDEDRELLRALRDWGVRRREALS